MFKKHIAAENKALRAYCDKEGLTYRQDRTQIYGYSDTPRKKKAVDFVETVDKSGESSIIKERSLLNLDLQYFAEIPKEKFTKYALDPIRQPDKARAFREALGYTMDNYQELIDNISDNLDENSLRYKDSNAQGKLYEYIMRLTGANGKQANVCTAWIVEVGKSEPRLTSAYVTKKKVTKKNEN